MSEMIKLRSSLILQMWIIIELLLSKTGGQAIQQIKTNSKQLL